MVICRKERVGTWSQSKIATYSPWVSGQRRVDVARFGMLIVRAGDVAATDFRGELPELLAASVIEDVHLEEFARIIEIHRRPDGITHHAKRLVVGGDENINRWPGARIFRHRRGLALQRAYGLEKSEQQHREGVQLRNEQDDHEHHVDRPRLRPALGTDSKGVRDPVEDVSRRTEDRHGRQAQRRQVGRTQLCSSPPQPGSWQSSERAAASSPAEGPRNRAAPDTALPSRHARGTRSTWICPARPSLRFRVLALWKPLFGPKFSTGTDPG